MLIATMIKKKILVKEMEPNFVRMKVPEKEYLQVRRISVAYKCCKELLKMSVKAHELAYLSDGDCLISLDIGILRARADNKEYWLLQKQNILLSNRDPSVPV